MDENMSNLTSASGEVSASSGSRIETGAIYPQHSFDSTNQPPPKKKKSFPGNPGFKSSRPSDISWLQIKVAIYIHSCSIIIFLFVSKYWFHLIFHQTQMRK
jgi:hypothetical protein